MRRREVVFSVALVTSVLLLPYICCVFCSANIPGSQRPNMKPRRPSWKKLQPAEKEIVAEVAKQLRLMGDKYNLKQKILNVVTKILSPGT
ncbi:PREDICTED: phorbol-12-myristate-13-acetate-induced protein 1 [Nanorana parkeri]|uniref:phorbol-12-myristate-13-acetate-induced protein 1 n=1 Tax=Nanorana parkeri TaxID=125878 RepID=UPI000854D062|nr:PREDICTED: phorbol-12-myristate-13-acetate-induced protein 1 [Nanorana parkeri]